MNKQKKDPPYQGELSLPLYRALHFNQNHNTDLSGFSF